MQINKDFFNCFGDLPKRRKTRGVCIHHTCTASPKKTRAVLKAKKCSTHFEIDRDGTIYQYADISRKCAHCGSNNHQLVSIDLTHLAGAEFPLAQLRSLRALCDGLAERYGIPRVIVSDLPAAFYFHRAIGDTVCPQDVPEDLFSDDLYAGEAASV